MVDLQKIEALAKAATPQNFDSAEDKVENGYIECPHCGGNGEVELEADYCNYDNSALGVQFYGIGGEFGAAEAFYRACNPSAVLELIAELKRAKEAARFLSQETDRIIEMIGKGYQVKKGELSAEIAGLKTGYEAYERVNTELRAECEALRKDADRLDWLTAKGEIEEPGQGDVRGFIDSAMSKEQSHG